jgi:hypothetical protein
MKRTVYADKDEIYSRLMADRDAALASASITGMPKYRKQYWSARARGLEYAAHLIRDWAGETEPDPALSEPKEPRDASPSPR